jgi:hypothetical protein
VHIRKDSECTRVAKALRQADASLRPSEEIALVVTDYDAAHGVLSITKARVGGIDKDVTKTGEDRRIVLCSRAIAVIERQLRLRQQSGGAGSRDHLA